MVVERVKGMCDFFGKEAIALSSAIEQLKQVFERWGFQPFFTPVLEYSATLRTKISPEMLGLLYEFKDRAGRQLGLRYDLTLGLARVAAQQQLPLPFKRYQIERAYRYEAPQAGRYREFWQADIDMLGIESAWADAECLACALDALKVLGIKDVKVHVNSRKLLDHLTEKLRIKERIRTYQILDKLEKIGAEAVKQELKKLIGKRAEQLLETLSALNESAFSEDLKELWDYAQHYGIKQKLYFDPYLVRGLAYYTGLIYEIKTEATRLSIVGGGRWDDLIERLGKRSIPATGLSIGLSRLLELLPKEKHSLVKLLVIPIKPELQKHAIKLTLELRQAVPTELAMKPLKQALSWADKQNIPYVVLIGPKEISQKKLKLREMASGSEKLLTLKQLKAKLAILA